MQTVSVKHARQHLAELLSQIARGSTVSITRRGHEVAVLAPTTTHLKQGLPSMAAFRDTIGLGRKPAQGTIEALRRDQRY